MQEEEDEEELKLNSIKLQNLLGEELQRERNQKPRREKEQPKRKGSRRRVGENLTKGRRSSTKTAFSLFILPNLHLVGLTLFDRACNYLTWTAH